MFNTTIKENILYGNDQADDAQVRQVAEMANALQFIESNIEDLDKEDVKKEIENKFTSKLENLLLTYQNFSKILEEHYNGNLRFEEINIIHEIIEKSDDKLKSLINEDAQKFISFIKNSGTKKGMKWDDLVTLFEWSFEE